MKVVKEWQNSDRYHAWYFNDEKIVKPTGKVTLPDGTVCTYKRETFSYWYRSFHYTQEYWSNRLMVKIPFQDTFFEVPIEDIDILSIEEDK
jgi:hypothetical protein